MKVIIDLPESVLKKLEKKALQHSRSRKNYMEFVLRLNALNTKPPFNKSKKPCTPTGK